MKKIALLLMLCLGWLGHPAPLRAQALPPDSLRQHLDYLFAPLDKTQVPAPFLEEYGLRFLPLDVFNGTLTDSSRTNIQAFRMAYASLCTGLIKGSNPLPTLADLNTRLRTQVAASAAVPIIVQRIDYAALRSDALTTGLFTTQSGQLYDAPGRSQSPYLQRVLFMASPERNTVRSGDVSFVFTQNLHVQSGGGSLRSISLDFGDGRGYLPVTWGQPIGANYCTVGTKRVAVRVSYYLPNIYGRATPVTGPTRQPEQAAPPQPQYVTYDSHFDLEVSEPGCAQPRYSTGGFTQSFAATSQHSGGQVFIRFGTNGTTRTQLTRPLIVAEGYDVSSIAPKLQDNYNITDFLNSITGSGLYNSLENAANSIPGGPAGYDIVFIDYNNGTDDIRRNAALFRDVVAWVNANKVGGITTGEKNVVLGISMGGLVARYGLAQMERAQPNSTHTRLLITHDSPHRGANTPLGLQALTRQANATLGAQIIGGVNSLFGTDIFPELFQAEALLDAPATQQLLLVRSTRSGFGPSPFSSFSSSYNSFINTDYQPMVAGAFSYRFIATSLGSQCAVPSLSPYAELVRYSFVGFLSPLPWIRRTSYETEIIVNAMPNAGQVERISSLRIFRSVRTLMVFTNRTYLTNFSFHSPASNPVAWDGLPGGTQNVKNQARINPPTPNFSLLWFFSLQGNFQTAGDFCFIPTASALDVPLTTATTQASYINNLTSGPTLPVPIRFLAQERINTTLGLLFNYPHPLFPTRQAQWIFNEMQGLPSPQACSQECSATASLVISGPPTVCGTTTYTSPMQDPGYTYAWSTTQPSRFTTTTGTGPTFTTSNIGSSSAYILLTVTTNCGPVSFSKYVTIGQPAMPATTGPNWGQDCGSVPVECTIDNFDPQATYSVSVTGALALIGGVSATGTYIVRSKTAGSSGTLTLTATNLCGSTSSTRTVYTPNCRSAAPAATAALYPNPARETVDVHTSDASPGQPITVRLFDAYGRPRAEARSTGQPTVRLATDRLPAGLYFVHILRGTEVLSRQQLRIEK
jgi:hypothetical protein